MNLLQNAIAPPLRNKMPNDVLIGVGVCYHCRGLVWDGTGLFWSAPLLCPHCHQPLILAFAPTPEETQDLIPSTPVVLERFRSAERHSYSDAQSGIYLTSRLCIL